MPKTITKNHLARLLVLILGLAWLLVGWGAVPAQAHKVSVFAYQEGGLLKGEGYFAGGEKAQQSTVELLDGQGQVIATAQTDQQGQFMLKMPPVARGPLKVLLKAGMGHQAQYTLAAADLSSPAPVADSSLAPGALSGQSASGSQGGGEAGGEMEERLGRLLDQRLQPLTAQIARLNADSGVTVTEVVGGLGYILGLLGLAAYLKYRQGPGGPGAR